MPAWWAVIVQLPPPVMRTVLPVNVQFPLADRVTGRPLLAVALTENGASPNVRSGNGEKVIVWVPRAMMMFCVTGGAGKKLASPAWVAVNVHVPAAVGVIVRPTTVQVPAAVTCTSRPELAVGLTENDPALRSRPDTGGKLIVWAARAMVKVRATAGAG